MTSWICKCAEKKLVEPTIVAIGGGGFDSDNPTPWLDRYLLDLTGQTRPKVCLIPTASGDSLIRIARFNLACERAGCHGCLLELFRPPAADLDAYLAECDLIFVSGGSTRNLLALWREWGLDEILWRQWQVGKVLAGVSAGANCWFESCSTDSNFGPLSALPALGWLPGSCCPHYHSELERRPRLQEMLESGELGPGIAIDDKVAVRYAGTSRAEVVAEAAGIGTAYEVAWQEKMFCETPLSLNRSGPGT